MANYTNLEGHEDLLNSITALEQELSAKLGTDVAVVAYSPVKYAALDDDGVALAKITALEQELAEKTGKNIALVAFTF